MTNNKAKKWKIEGHLDIFTSRYEDDSNNESIKSDEILIHGNPEGLRSFAKLLIEIADLNQEK